MKIDGSYFFGIKTEPLKLTYHATHDFPADFLRNIARLVFLGWGPGGLFDGWSRLVMVVSRYNRDVICWNIFSLVGGWRSLETE